MSYKAFCNNYGDHTTRVVGRHCWNEEATKHMRRDMMKIWVNFVVHLDTRFEHILQAISDAFEDALRLGRSGDITGTDIADQSRSAVRTLLDILCHRQCLVLYGAEDAIDESRNELSYLESDALAPLRTAFVGRYMEDTYHAANMDYGKFRPFDRIVTSASDYVP